MGGICNCRGNYWRNFSLLREAFFTLGSRLELFCPVDQPVIFDRKNSKVYRIFRETQPGVKGLFTRWPFSAAEFDWDLIDAEHTTILATTGSTIPRYHALVFSVRKRPADPTIIDSFNIGNMLGTGELTVAPVWEHIRRYMEENGPALSPGHTLEPDAPPQKFWQSFCVLGPFLLDYRASWRGSLPFMLLFHVLLPVCVQCFLLLGSLNWPYKTAIPIHWPQEVLDAVGPRIEYMEN